jgi:ketosteroid isomerase-like protein
MPHPNEEVVRRAYAAINRRDIDAFVAAFAENAVWHGSGQSIVGSKPIGALVGQLIDASGGSLQIDLHDVLANDEHVVVLQTTRAERQGRRLEDNVVYVFHVVEGKIAEAWFSGDPRVQDEFWS